MRRGKKRHRGRVGVDEGERLEAGVGRRKREEEVTLRRSTHGRQKGRGGRERGYPMKSGLEVEHVRRGIGVGTTTTRQEGERKRETRGEGGRRCGWGTLLVPNRYNYFLEGHRVNRISPSIASSSRMEGGQSRGE